MEGEDKWTSVAAEPPQTEPRAAVFRLQMAILVPQDSKESESSLPIRASEGDV